MIYSKPNQICTHKRTTQYVHCC